MLARIALAGLVVAAFAVLLGLGTWQLQRLAWKEALIAAASERPDAPPVPAPGPPTWDDFALKDWNYQRVSLTGRYGEGEAYAWIVLSDARGPHAGPGHFVVAPFTSADGWHVLVNRGFVPGEPSSGAAPPAGEVTIEAIVRRDDPPNFVTPAPNLARNVFFTRDIGAIAAALGLPPERTAPYSLDLVAEATPPSGLPQAGESRLTFSNNHLQYAITWYGLAAALAAVTAAAVLRKRRPTSS